MFDAYRLTILKVFPNLFVNSVWLMPLVANASFIQFLHILCFAHRCLYAAKLLQKSEMRKDIVIELSYKGFG